jgi:hypothetical protein
MTGSPETTVSDVPFSVLCFVFRSRHAIPPNPAPNAKNIKSTAASAQSPCAMDMDCHGSAALAMTKLEVNAQVSSTLDCILKRCDPDQFAAPEV